jgi:hypothetical protein
MTLNVEPTLTGQRVVVGKLFKFNEFAIVTLR